MDTVCPQLSLLMVETYVGKAVKSSIAYGAKHLLSQARWAGHALMRTTEAQELFINFHFGGGPPELGARWAPNKLE